MLGILDRFLPEYSNTSWTDGERRRLRVLDFAALTVFALMGLHTLSLIIMRIFVWEWLDPSFYVQILIMFAALLVVPAHRYGYYFKLHTFFTWVLIYVIYFSLVARPSSSQFTLYAAPCVLVFFLGTKRKWAPIGLTILAYLLAFFITTIIPLDIAEKDFFEEVPANISKFIEFFDFETGTWMFVIASMGTIMFITTYSAYAELEKSEAALEREHARSEMLLRSLLPGSVATRLKDQPEEILADEFEEVTILFADVVGFTERSHNRPPTETVAFLNRLFSRFDTLTEKYGLEKIKTIGDEYMVAGGMPDKKSDHASALANLALDMIIEVESVSEEIDEKIEIRVGLHAGPAVAGVIGRKKPFYDVWGDTINIASRMQSSTTPGSIQITPELKELLGERYEFHSCGKIDVKGKGQMSSYLLVGKLTSQSG